MPARIIHQKLQEISKKCGGHRPFITLPELNKHVDFAPDVFERAIEELEALRFIEIASQSIRLTEMGRLANLKDCTVG